MEFIDVSWIGGRVVFSCVLLSLSGSFADVVMYRSNTEWFC